MTKQQTAVEWLVDQLTDELHEAYHPVLAKLYESAKEMEKQQIKDAFEESRLTHPIIGFKHRNFEEYYNEKYGDEQA